MIALLATSALAADRSDLAVTSLGAQGVRAEALGDADLDLLLGQRVRWGLADDVTLLGDGRFTVDPAGTTTWEQSRLRSLGLAYEGRVITVLAGRHAVRHGGARLVDGVQALLHPGNLEALDVGLWGGLVPDPFTTRPLARPGIGPVIGWNGSGLSGSALGEVVLGTAGGLDRLGGLLQAQASWAPALVVSGRLDWLFADAQGRSGLADGAASVNVRPTDALRLDASYNAYSSLRYQTTAILDPTVQRFQQRVESLGLQDFILADDVDPTLQHVFGAGVRLRPDGGVRPVLGLIGRARAHPEPTERYARVGPQIGVAGLAGDRLELLADANVMWLEGRTTGDGGINAIVDLLEGGAVLADGSARLLIDGVGYDGRPGWYADLFLDGVAKSGTVVAVGGSWTLEPSDVLGSDVGWAAFLRLQQWIRPGRSTPRLEPVAVEDEEEPEAEMPE